MLLFLNYLSLYRKQGSCLFEDSEELYRRCSLIRCLPTEISLVTRTGN